MTRILAILLCLLAAPHPLGAQSVAEDAGKAALALQAAVADLQEATTAQDRIAALTSTIRAYENGLAALREALREAQMRQSVLETRLGAKREEVAELLGVLTLLERQPGPLLLLHPSGPLGTVRAGMLLADVTPTLQSQAQALAAQLQELHDLRALQAQAGKTLNDGLAAAQAARSALSQAISERTNLPKRLTDDPEALRQLLESADTLDAFAAGIAPDTGDAEGFADAKGRLPLPVLGRLIRRAGEADARGTRRPGISLATGAQAIVTTPWPATIRYLGPLLDYGNVIVLEPGGGYLIVLAGLGTLYGQVGEVLAAGAPVGMMGGADPDGLGLEEGGGATASETLYMELRQGAAPVDPAEWFAALRE